MLKRSEVRHALYRLKKTGIKSEDKTFIYDMVEPLIPAGESWESFSSNWDVILKHDAISIIKPETNYDYVHDTCLEMALCSKKNIEPDFDDRQRNIISTVEGTMLEGKMEWSEYNKTWGLTLDMERKFINTKLYSTYVNEVTEEMIKNSAKSDGAAMEETPTIPQTELELTSFTPNPVQLAVMDSLYNSGIQEKGI